MTKIALLIGINYYGTSAELRGCINDVNNINNYLISYLSYNNNNIYKLTDNNGENTNISTIPTKQNIINSLNIIINRIKNENDITELFLFYSGHGSNVYDLNGDEKDSMDEVLIPVDYKNGNIITDDELNKIISNIPSKCKMFGLFDCCNSGSMLDLKYLFKSIKYNSIENKSNNLIEHNNIFMVSGCKDNQTSADFYNNVTNKFAGALTTSFLNSCKKLNYNNITFIKLIQYMRSYLKNNNFTQIPQITSNKQINDKSYYIKDNKLLIQYVQPPPPPPKPSPPKPSPPKNKPRKIRFRNRGEYLKYLKYLRYLRYLRNRRYRR